MKTFYYLRRMILSPRRTSQELAQESSLRYSAALVLGYGLFLSLGFLISALIRDYPPPPETLQVWIDAWGEFTMLPFLKHQWRAIVLSRLQSCSRSPLRSGC